MKTLRLVSVTCIVLSFGGRAGAMFALPTPAPIDRLIANTTAYIKEKPNHAHGYYTLARIHYLAFVNRSKLVPAFERERLPKVAEDWEGPDVVYMARYRRAEELALKEFGYSSEKDIPYEEREKFYKAKNQKRKELEEEGWVPEKLAENELYEHAGAALENFDTAIELDSKNALYHHGRASLLEQYVQFLAEIDARQMRPPFRDLLLKAAKESYYAAFTLSINKDSKLRHRPLSGLQELVSHEAGQAYIRLSKKVSNNFKKEADRVKKVRKGLKKLGTLPESGIVTPVIFSLDKHQSLADLLQPDRFVCFDLDGDGVRENWPWLKATTAILVWDPEEKGQITSGRQMFGSVTWWLFFRDGYHALDALDDNRDGELTGTELEGICVWFDRNCDGKSGQGEVISLRELQIVCISTKATGKTQGCPISASGIRLSDGRTLPTYDWLTSPVERKTAGRHGVGVPRCQKSPQ